MRHNIRDSKGRFIKAKEAYMAQKLYPYPLDAYHEDLQEMGKYITAMQEAGFFEGEDDNESLLRDFLQAAAVTLILLPLAAILFLAVCWIITNC